MPAARCSLCGNAPEDSFHAVVECPQARTLCWAMREHWPLPDERLVKRTGPDWLLLLPDRCTKEEGELLILVFFAGVDETSALDNRLSVCIGF